MALVRRSPSLLGYYICGEQPAHAGSDSDCCCLAVYLLACLPDKNASSSLQMTARTPRRSRRREWPSSIKH
eukprot:SAG22_NODE_3061_length_1972_cov_0.942872_3_plen_70_part_01